MANVQKEPSFLAASCTRKQRGVQSKTSGKPQEEEAQVTQNYPRLAVNTCFCMDSFIHFCPTIHI